MVGAAITCGRASIPGLIVSGHITQGLAAFSRHYQLNIVHDHFQVIWVLNSTSQTPYTGCPKTWLIECNWSPKILTKIECCLQSFGSCTYYVITFGSPEQFVISCLNLDLSVQKCDYLQDQEVNLRNLAQFLASCVASEMTSGVRATLLFVGHQLRPIGLPVACTVVFCTVVFCTVVFCTASSACSTSANMPLGCM